MTNKEFEAFTAKALEQLKSGQSLTGKDGVFAPLLKSFLNQQLNTNVHLFFLPFLIYALSI